MPENASVFTGVQLGVETVPGTAVAANKRMSAFGINPSPAFESDQYGPDGQKFDTLSTLIYEASEFDITGRQTYSEIIYPLASLITKPTPTTPAGGTTAKEWLFTSDKAGPDAPATYTIEFGSSVRGARITNGIVNELTLTWSKTAALEMSGSGFGKAIEDPFTLTASPTVIALTPVVNDHFDVYAEITAAALVTPTVRLTRDFSYSWTFSGRYSQVRVINSTTRSFETHVEARPELNGALRLAYDAQGAGFWTQIRDGSKRFVGVHADGAIIETTIKYRVWVDTCFAFTDSDGFDDEDGTRVIEWGLGGLYDGTWDKAFLINVRNLQATL